MNGDLETEKTVIASINPATRTISYKSMTQFRQEIVDHTARDERLEANLKKGIVFMLAFALLEAVLAGAYYDSLLGVAVAAVTIVVMVGCSIYSAWLIRLCKQRQMESAWNLEYVDQEITAQERAANGEYESHG